MELSSADKLENAFKDATMAGSSAVAATSTAFVNANSRRIAAFAMKFRLPAVGARSDFVENGGLLSYGPDTVEIYRRAAWMVDKILKGAKPAAIPVEQPMKFELMINLKTAKALNLTIPQPVLYRADRVIR